MIVVEGIEGAGKSTAIDAIYKLLDEKQINFISVREPGGTEVGEALRAILKADHNVKLEAATELLLMYASRTQLYHKKIQPALARGTWVVADRFELSSYAYQGFGRQLPLQYLKTLSALCLDNFKPDLTLFLDISLELSQQRITQRGVTKDRIEQEAQSFFYRVRQGYLQYAEADERIKIIDASHDKEQVAAAVIEQVSQL